MSNINVADLSVNIKADIDKSTAFTQIEDAIKLATALVEELKKNQSDNRYLA